MSVTIVEKELDEFIDKLANLYDIPGLVVGIGSGISGLEYVRAVGYKDYEKEERLSAENIFHMASVTKLFVGTSVLLLKEKGILSLEDKLTKHLPWFKMEDDRYKKVTLRQMLSHSSGMGDCEDYHWGNDDYSDGALKKYVMSPEVKNTKFKFNPGENKFAYSNIAYEILGVVISELSGMTFEEYVQKNIFDPLEMEDSTLLTFLRFQDMSHVCTPHEKDGDNKIISIPTFPYNREHCPSSTLTSNVYDLSKFAVAILKKDSRLLPESLYKEIWTPVTTVPNNGEGMGISWFIREQNGRTFYGHEGTDDGFRASFWLCPEDDSFIIVTANISGGSVKKISKQVYEKCISLS